MSGKTYRLNGEVVRHLRAKKNWSQTQLANAVRRSVDIIQDIERGLNSAGRPTRVRPATCMQLAVAFGVPEEQLRLKEDDSTLSQPRTDQYFAVEAAYEAVRQHVQSFDAFIADRTRGFIPRDYLSTELDAFIGREPSGYFLVKGLPGLGKSAFLAHLVKSRGCIHHFNIAAESRNRPDKFLSNICAQLILRFQLPHYSLPPTASEGPSVLLKLLQQAVETRQVKPLLIVVDALDEVECHPSETGNILHLPTTLPEGVYVVATTRPLHDRDPRSQLLVSTSHVVTLSKDAPWHRRDVQTYLENSLKQKGIIAWMAAADLSPKRFVEVLMEKSEANFMYLRHVLPELSQKALSGAFLTPQLLIQELPHGLLEYFRRHWLQMQRIEPKACDDLNRPVLCSLAAAREEIPLSRLAEWTGLEPAQVRSVLRSWREFIDVARTTDQEETYRIYHHAFREFLRLEVDVGLASARTQIIRVGLQKYGRRVAP